MNNQTSRGVFNTKRYGIFSRIVPFGAIFLVLCLPAIGGEQKKNTVPPSEIKGGKIILERLRDLKQKIAQREELRKRQDVLLDRLSDIRENREEKGPGPGNIIARRGMERTSGELHQLLEENRKIAREQKTIVEFLLEHKEGSFAAIDSEKKRLEKEIRSARKSRRISEKAKSLERELQQLETARLTLEILDQNPDAMLILGISPDAPPSPPDPESGEFRRRWRTDRHSFPEKREREHAGARIQQQIRNMQKQMKFLKNQMTRTERQLDYMEKIINNIQRNHPEYFEEIRDEIPPPPPEDIPAPLKNDDSVL